MKPDFEIEIIDRLSSIESDTKFIRQNQSRTEAEVKALNVRVDHVESQIDKASGSIRTIHYVIGLAFGVPGVLFAILRMFGKL